MLSGDQRSGSGCRAVEYRRHNEEEQQRDDASDSDHASQSLAEWTVEGFGCFVEVHYLYDAKVIERTDHTGDDADDRERIQLGFDRREEDVEVFQRNQPMAERLPLRT